MGALTRSRSAISVWLGCFVLVVAGCGKNGIYAIDLMPAPDVYDEETIHPFIDTDPIGRLPYRGILYATDRMPAPEDAKEPYYLDQRGFELRLGLAQITLGDEQISWEEARRISLLKNRTDKYPLMVTGAQEFGVLESTVSQFTPPGVLGPDPSTPGRRFAALVDEKLAQSVRKDVYIYVHGYKVVFDSPVLVASELWHFLGYNGVFIAYAWPSTPATLAYASDLETAALSAHNLRELIKFLARETEVERIHVIGYSAGTRVVINSMFQLALEHNGMDETAIREKLRIGHVIVVGSDFDRRLFGAYLDDGLLGVSERLSVYVSETDKALGMSRLLFGRDRLGQMWRNRAMPESAQAFLRGTRDLVLIDVTGIEGSTRGNGHAYFRSSPWASSDILMTLLYDLSPQERGIVMDSEVPVWVFPEDYIERLRAKLRELNPELAARRSPRARVDPGQRAAVDLLRR